MSSHNVIYCIHICIYMKYRSFKNQHEMEIVIDFSMNIRVIKSLRGHINKNIYVLYFIAIFH